MKKTVIVFVHVMVLFLITSCSKGVIGSGPIVSEVRNVNEFHKISNAGSMNLHILYGTTYKVEIQAQNNIIPYIRTTIVGDELVIDIQEKINFIRAKDIEVYITCPSYNSLTIDGSGNIDANVSPNENNLKLTIAGSGNISCSNISTQHLGTLIAGSGNIEVKGTCNSETAEIAGSGNIKSYDMISDSCNASIGGSGSIYINVNTTLEATINGSGSIFYKGNPRVNTTINGSGMVKKVN